MDIFCSGTDDTSERSVVNSVSTENPASVDERGKIPKGFYLDVKKARRAVLMRGPNGKVVNWRKVKDWLISQGMHEYDHFSYREIRNQYNYTG